MNCLKCFLNFTEKEGLKTTPNSECALNALAIDNPVKYARLYLDGTIQMWIDAEDSLVSLRGIFLPIVFFHLATFNCHLFALWFIILNKNSIKHNVIGNRSPMRMPT